MGLPKMCNTIYVHFLLNAILYLWPSLSGGNLEALFSLVIYKPSFSGGNLNTLSFLWWFSWPEPPV